MSHKRILKVALIVLLVMGAAVSIWYWQFTKSLNRDLAELGKGLNELSQGLSQISTAFSKPDTVQLDSIPNPDTLNVQLEDR